MDLQDQLKKLFPDHQPDAAQTETADPGVLQGTRTGIEWRRSLDPSLF